jgi:putative ABC transport system ATP-binding protein
MSPTTPASAGPAAGPCIRLRGLTRVLDSGGRPLTVLDSVDLDVEDGEFVAILGPSGSGKSTLLALLAGLDRPTAGEVLVHGRPVHTLDEDALARWRRADVGFVFQSFQLLDTFTAEENVMFPMELLGRPGARERARALLDAVGLGARGHHYPRQLSGGEQQRVAVARAFSASPRLLLADEPTGNLDGPTGRVVLDALDRLRQEAGTTVVLVTHDPAIGARAQRRVRFRDGRVESDERGASA